MNATQTKTMNQSQKLMVFVLTMSLYGLATLFTELIPKFQVGLVEFSVEYFLFIPLTPQTVAVILPVLQGGFRLDALLPDGVGIAAAVQHLPPGFSTFSTEAVRPAWSFAQGTSAM